MKNLWVLNTSLSEDAPQGPVEKIVKPDPSPENCEPAHSLGALNKGFSFSGATNFTVNFNFGK